MMIIIFSYSILSIILLCSMIIINAEKMERFTFQPPFEDVDAGGITIIYNTTSFYCQLSFPFLLIDNSILYIIYLYNRISNKYY